MKSRYQGLRAFGTLALIIAWIILILGILAAVGTWLGINALATEPVGWSFFAAIPGLLFAIMGFIQFYIIGKVLHLLVDMDGTVLDVHEKIQTPAPAAASDGSGEIAGELKRQAKLIASNLEATQSLQQQIGSLQSRAGGLAAPAPVSSIEPPAPTE